VTQRELKAGDQPMKRVRIMLDNIPTEGLAKWIAVVNLCDHDEHRLYVHSSKKKKASAGQEKPKARRTRDPDTERARSRLVAEIASLDTAHAAGEWAPKRTRASVRALLMSRSADDERRVTESGGIGPGEKLWISLWFCSGAPRVNRALAYFAPPASTR